MKIAVHPSAEQPRITFYACHKIIKCICVKQVSSNVIKYLHVSIAFVIIIGAALQEYEEYNNLPH
jgi:hypothetical protein